MKPDSKRTLTGCLVIILIIVGIIAGFSWCRFSEESKIKDLIANVPQYAAMKGDYKKAPVKQPPKFFIVQNDFDDTDKNNEFIHSPAYFSLPKDLQATSVSDLNTLVQLNIYQKPTGKYTDGALSITEYVDILVFDLASGNVIAKKTLSDDPRSTKWQGSGDQKGHVVESEISDYLVDLCRIEVKRVTPKK
ncbi:MAG: hypothetical protein WCL54_06505 [Clostridia bacterium]